ncbi:MAG: 1,4-alpha-glucan branching protein GlgB [Actinomycetota bacterium]
MAPVPDVAVLGDHDLHLFNEGTHTRLFDRLGALPVDGGTVFRVWAPDADAVSVVGDFNGWNGDADHLGAVGSTGLWESFIPGVGSGAIYKLRVRSKHGYVVDKADPVAAFAETPPRTASVVWELGHEWNDADWLASRGERQARDRPMSIYEVHLGSWKRKVEDGDRWLTYRELGVELADHCTAHGFTHVEVLPVAEFPFDGSWGYQGTGFFAPTSRFGTPDDFCWMVDHLHQHGIGVIVDWVPSHFPSDEHGLGYFDGTYLYEHLDPRRRIHPDWGSLSFNYGRNEVRSFLLSSGRNWIERYHVDGLRVDAVASMLYLDYSRKDGEWSPNAYGGKEDLDAIAFLRQCNAALYEAYPDIVTIAEESTAWPMVSRPPDVGGLGFGFKWDMGWMHDTLDFLSKDPIHRRFHHDQLTFRSLYVASENYVLPLSHDEVVHGKGSLLGKMPGDRWQQFANLRLLYGWQHAQPGKKLLFMGGEFGQVQEWSHERSLDWHLLDDELHAGMLAWVGHLNRLHQSVPALHERDCEGDGLDWVVADDRENSVFALLRRDHHGHPLLAVLNATPVPRPEYRVGVPGGMSWTVVANSDDPTYGGSGYWPAVGVESSSVPSHGRPASVVLDLPPMSLVMLLDDR